MSADPLTLGIGGAVLGGMMDKENPLRGAALGGLGGAVGGPLFNAAEPAAAAKAFNAAGPASFEAAMAAPTSMGSTIANPASLGGNAANFLTMNPASSIMSPTMTAGQMGGLMGQVSGGAANLATGTVEGLSGAASGASSGLLGNQMADKALNMGGQMLMKNEQAKQGQPVMPGVAPPMMKPNFAMPSFMQSAPNFRPAIGGLPVNHPVAANPRMRG